MTPKEKAETMNEEQNLNETQNGNFAKPMLPAGRIIQQKLKLKNKCKHKF